MRDIEMNEQTFTCNFTINGSSHFATASDISVFQSGFYIDADYCLAKQKSEAAYWIPPGSISYIEIDI